MLVERSNERKFIYLIKYISKFIKNKKRGKDEIQLVIAYLSDILLIKKSWSDIFEF